MSGPATPGSDAGTATTEVLRGWGRAAPSAATVVSPSSPDEVTATLSAATGDRPVLARGLGRAYGDAAQCAGGVVLDCRSLDRLLALDDERAEVRLGAGVSLDALLPVVVPRGFFVPVTPGTRYVTVGGAIAADVHGKNHHLDGTIGMHVRELSLVTPNGTHRIGPGSGDRDLYWATAGGMGLTGVITEATVALPRIDTAMMLVDTERATDLEDCLARMDERDDQYRYSVAWIDCMARGGKLGRAVLTRANHAGLSDLAARARSDPLAYRAPNPVPVPLEPPVSLLNALTVAAFNEAWYRRAPRQREGELQTIPAYFHPLDGVARWNLLYGRRGFTQYQFVVPFGREDTLRLAIERLSRARVASFLAVLKRFGAANPGPLSFPMPGWTLALDMPLGVPGLPGLLDDLDHAVAEAGGRVYLAKDGRVRPSLLAQMYPNLASWKAVRRRVDPDGVLASDLGRRLGLVA